MTFDLSHSPAENLTTRKIRKSSSRRGAKGTQFRKQKKLELSEKKKRKIKA